MTLPAKASSAPLGAAAQPATFLVIGTDSRIGLAISLLLITPVAFVLFKRWALRA